MLLSLIILSLSVCVLAVWCWCLLTRLGRQIEARRHAEGMLSDQRAIWRANEESAINYCRQVEDGSKRLRAELAEWVKRNEALSHQLAAAEEANARLVAERKAARQQIDANAELARQQADELKKLNAELEQKLANTQGPRQRRRADERIRL